jgi:hypothetical protein
MTDNISATFEQMMVLVWFCRKVSIPFKIYGFSDNTFTYIFNKNYPRQISTIDMSHFYLKEYFSSDMASDEFQQACLNIHCLMNYFNFALHGCIRAPGSLTLPDTEVLSNTPLDVSIIAATKIIKEFRNKKNFQNVNVIFLTDGQSSGLPFTDSFGKRTNDYYYNNIILRNPKTKKEYRPQSRQTVTEKLFEYLWDETQVNIIGFYIINSSWRRGHIKNALYSVLGNSYTKELARRFFKEGQLYLKNIFGYDEYYVLASQELEIKEEKNLLDIDDQKMNNKKMATVLSKNLNSRLRNRVILSKFIEKIA